MCSMYSSIIWISNPLPRLGGARRSRNTRESDTSLGERHQRLYGPVAGSSGKFNIGVGPRLSRKASAGACRTMDNGGADTHAISGRRAWQECRAARSMLANNDAQAVVAKPPRHKAQSSLLSGADHRVVTSVVATPTTCCELASTWISGYCRMNPCSVGIMSMPTSGRLTFKRPLGVDFDSGKIRVLSC